jgi:hypothetical protein
MSTTNTKPLFSDKKYRTGKATAIYPAVTKPDTKYKEEGQYKVDVTITDEAQIDRMRKAYEEAKELWSDLSVPATHKKKLEAGKAKVADVPWDENEDGTYRVRIRRAAYTKAGKHQKIKVINKQKRLLTGDDAEFGHASVVDVGFSVKVWFTAQLGFGVTFMPDIVMLHEAKFEGGGSPDDYGFEAEGDDDEDDDYGFDAEESADGDEEEW